MFTYLIIGILISIIFIIVSMILTSQKSYNSNDYLVFLSTMSVFVVILWPLFLVALSFYVFSIFVRWIIDKYMEIKEK
jgi:hypothetical protein